MKNELKIKTPNHYAKYKNRVLDYMFKFKLFPSYEKHQIWLFKLIDNWLNSDSTLLKICLCGAKGVGKTSGVACLVPFFMSTIEDAKINIMSGKRDQSKEVLLEEISQIIRKSLVNENDFSITATKITCELTNSDLSIKSFSKDSSGETKLAGSHSEFIVFIVDEAPAVPDEYLKQTFGIGTTGKALLIFTGNPEDTVNLFYNIMVYPSQYPSWISKSISYFECSRHSEQKRADTLSLYPPDTDDYRKYILGKHVLDKPFCLLQEKYFSRILFKRENIFDILNYINGFAVVGVDVASGNDLDYSCVSIKFNNQIHILSYENKQDVNQLCELINYIISRVSLKVIFVIDCDGAGLHLWTMLKNRGYAHRMIRFHANITQGISDLCYNLRDNLYHRLAHYSQSDKSRIFYSRDNVKDELINETNLTTFERKEGKIVLTDKKKLPKSPDILDSLSLTLYFDNDPIL